MRSSWTRSRSKSAWFHWRRRWPAELDVGALDGALDEFDRHVGLRAASAFHPRDAFLLSA